MLQALPCLKNKGVLRSCVTILDSVPWRCPAERCVLRASSALVLLSSFSGPTTCVLALRLTHHQGDPVHSPCPHAPCTQHQALLSSMHALLASPTASSCVTSPQSHACTLEMHAAHACSHAGRRAARGRHVPPGTRDGVHPRDLRAALHRQELNRARQGDGVPVEGRRAARGRACRRHGPAALAAGPHCDPHRRPLPRV